MNERHDWFSYVQKHAKRGMKKHQTKWAVESAPKWNGSLDGGQIQYSRSNAFGWSDLN